MIDLTPLDVRKKRGDFRKTLRGYDPVEVDTFLELVEDRLEALVMENLALSEKTARLETSLHALERRENAVQEALVSAQKLREEVTEQSRREVDLLRRETEGEVERMRRDAQAEIERWRRSAELDAERRILEVEGLIRDRQRSLEEMERNRRKFLKAFRTLLEREMDAVEVEEQRLPLEDVPIELELRGWRPPTELWLHLPDAGSGEEPAESTEDEAVEPRAPSEGAEADEEVGGDGGWEEIGASSGAADEPGADGTSEEEGAKGDAPSAGQGEGGPGAWDPAESAEAGRAEMEEDAFVLPPALEEPRADETAGEDQQQEDEPTLLAAREEPVTWDGAGDVPAEALSPGEEGTDVLEDEELPQEPSSPSLPLPEEPLWLSSLLKREELGEKKPQE